MYFTRATPKPASTPPTGDRNQPSQEKRQQGQSMYRYTPYPTNRVCFRWNSQAGCHLINCALLPPLSRHQSHRNRLPPTETQYNGTSFSGAPPDRDEFSSPRETLNAYPQSPTASCGHVFSLGLIPDHLPTYP